MAIGYSGPRGQSMLLKVDDRSGTDKSVYIQTKMLELQPLLTQPFILNLIKNTNGSNTNEFVNSRYYYNKKSGAATKISDSTDGVIVDPTTIEAESMTFVTKQFAPEQWAKKFKGAYLDLTLDGLTNAAAIKMSDYIIESRVTKQNRVFNEALSAAKQVQDTSLSTLTTFKTGAHFVKTTYVDANAAYKDLSQAIISFQKLGAANAIGQFNKDIPYVLGVPKQDMLVLMSDEFASMLFEKAGLFASDVGNNKLFQQLDLKLVLGVPAMITSTLPEGTNFMIITTGRCGALVYEEVGNVAFKKVDGKTIATLESNATMVTDPNWSGFYRIDYADIFKMGVLFPELIFVSTEADVVAASKTKKQSSEA